jgi:serine/threonine-protein kinase HipA
VLLSAAGAVRLAPLYDLASALAYPDIETKKIKLAMRIGGSYRLRDIGRRNWEKLASELRFTDAALINRLMEFATILPDHVADTARQLHSEHLHHDLIDRLAGQLISRAEDCLRVLSIHTNGSDQKKP